MEKFPVYVMAIKKASKQRSNEKRTFFSSFYVAEASRRKKTQFSLEVF
jgi:hypothetical protein